MSEVMRSNEFETALDAWVRAYQKMVDADSARFGENAKLLACKISVEPLQKYVRIVNTGVQCANRCSVAFIAMEDFETKQLGSVKRGDILKPVNWSRPAKHARGNIFDENRGMLWMNPRGVSSIRPR